MSELATEIRQSAGSTTSFGILPGVLIFVKWPASAEWAIGLLVGIKLVVDAIALLSLGMVGNKTVETVY